MKEMAYTPTQKDLTETKIHHMLSENLFMPRARVSTTQLPIYEQEYKMSICSISMDGVQ